MFSLAHVTILELVALITIIDKTSLLNICKFVISEKNLEDFNQLLHWY